MTKVCGRCRRRKPLSSFDRKSKLLGGRVSKCRTCRNAYANEWRRSPSGMKLYQKALERLKRSGYWRDRTLSISARFSRARRRAALVGLPWSIGLKLYESLLSKPCSYCRLPLEQKHGYGLDRIDNSLGYTKGNVAPCCSECNRIRSDRYTVEEMKSVLGPVIRKIKIARKRVSR